jgi:membrane-associated phospholipid phosphatase
MKKIERKKFIFLGIGALLLCLFFIFTFIVRADALRSFDFDTTVRLQSKIPLRFDNFFSFLSVAGRFEYTGSILLIILAIYGVYKKKIWAIIPLILFCLAHGVELVGKTILEQPGPPRMFLRTQFTDFPGLHVFTEASYPSGHSLRIVFLSIITGYIVFLTRIPNLIKYCLYAAFLGLVLVMLVSRVSLGEHWTTDVIGGSLLGTSFAFLALAFL